ncbi:MAG: hypothetical protein H6729_00195 [Deltaproteobacteria bacterium]|nr:hypothetical protein [Deltaproteobacteria bacterium]
MRNVTQCAVPIPCAAAELMPLLDFLGKNHRPEEQKRFPRGVVMPDGRLDLCKQQLGPQGVELVCRALRGNTTMTSPLVGADFMGDQGARHLANLVVENASLETLFLGCNGITPTGIS